MINFLYRILALGRKELISIWADPAIRAVLFVPIIIDTMMFGYGATYDLSNVRYAVQDLNRSPTSISLLAKFDGTGIFHRVLTVQTAAEIEQAVNAQQVLMAIRIGPQFEQQLLAGETASIQLIVDARNSTTANSAVAYAAAVVEGFNTEQRQLRGEASAPPIVLETRAWFNPGLLTRWNFVPALIAMLCAMQTLMLTALSVAREREQGTFDQLLVTPLSPTEIMIGKAVIPMMVGLTQATIITLLARFWFQIPMAGSPVTLYLGLAPYMLAIVGIGLSISALAPNMQQAILWTNMFMMPMILLSGFTTPVKSMPVPLQHIMMLNPMRYGIDLARRVYLEGVGVAAITYDIIPLLLMAAVTLPLAAWLFRHRMI